MTKKTSDNIFISAQLFIHASAYFGLQALAHNSFDNSDELNLIIHLVVVALVGASFIATVATADS